MTKAGLTQVENDYVKRQVENRKLKTVMDRVWIQGRFKKEASAPAPAPAPENKE